MENRNIKVQYKLYAPMGEEKKIEMIEETRPDMPFQFISGMGMVLEALENKLYPIERGDIIVTMPNEVHHCVYNSTSLHEDYCIWINAEGDMASILNLDTNRNKGEHNLISMSKEDKQRLL